MLRTPLCDLLGIEHPIIQGPIGPWSTAELVAAVSKAGGLGSVGTTLQSAQEVRKQIARVRELTDRPFAVNFTSRPFNEEAFALTLQARPRIVSFALSDPGELVEQAHDAGILFMQQVPTVKQAQRAAQREVDVIIAQGSEAGGFGGTVSTLALLPQVVEAVSPIIPIVAAGGIADGRGMAAALLLGAQGVNIGTRFLASKEAGIGDDWKQRIVEARSEEAIKVEFADYIFPPPGPGGYATKPRVLSTSFVEEWNQRPGEAAREAERLSSELMEALQRGKVHELVPFTGQTAGMIQEVLPVDEIVRGMVAQAEEIVRAAPDLLG